MSAPYFLAIDIGTSRTSAAVARSAPDGSLLATPFPLGRSSDNAPTVAFAADGELLFGDAAERRGHTQPERLIREYKRRIGDDVPILAADRAFAPEELYALTVDWAARAVVEREGATPAGLAITVPAAWGGYRGDLVREALTAQGWRDVVILTEPEAAARHYEATNPLADGRVLAVYDFGGGTFDAVALRKEPGAAVRILGSPTGIPDLGGADFDDTIVRHVVRTAQVDATLLAGTPSGRMALAALRRECVEAKESLSFDSEAVVPVLLGTEQRSVRLSRDEFESMIADDLERTVEAFQSALDEAGVDVADLEAILLTGGTSRIPRVAQVLSERFDRPIAVDADPKAIIALGAARAAADAAAAAAAAASVPDLDDGAGFALTETAPPAASPRRGRFRRVPSGAFVTVGAAALITGLGIAGAPALGTATLTAAERAGTTVEPVSLPDTDDAATHGPEPTAAAEPTSADPGPATASPPHTPAKKPAASPADRKSAAAQVPRATGTSGAAPASGTAQPTGGSTTPTGGSTTPAGSGATPAGSGSTSGATEAGGSSTTDPGGTDATGTDPGEGGDTGAEEPGGDGGAGDGTGTGDEGGAGGDGSTPGGGTETPPPPTDPAPQESPPPPEASPVPAAV